MKLTNTRAGSFSHTQTPTTDQNPPFHQNTSFNILDTQTTLNIPQANTIHHARMASNNSDEIISASSQNHTSSPSRQNALPTQALHQNITTSSATTNAHISRPAMAPAQPKAIVHPAPNTRGGIELRLMLALRHERAHLHDSNPFVDNLIGELQQVFEALYKVDSTGSPITEEGELQSRKLECVKAGLYGLRSILTAWLKYPAVGGRLDGAPIGVEDFMYTARAAAKEKPVGQLAAQYARIMGDAVDPPQDDFESAPHAQLRVNNCFLALKKQFMVLFPMLGHEELTNYMFDDDVLTEDEAAPVTYTLSSTAPLHPPSTAAQLMSARGLAAAAEDEDDDNQHVFVSGAVLKSKAEKRADLAVQVAKAKKAEMDEAARARVRGPASKAIANAQGKNKARKSDTPPVESEEDEEYEEDDEVVKSPMKKPAANKAAAKKIRGGRKRVSLSEEGSNAVTTQQPAMQPKLILRKRSAPEADVDDADEDTAKPAPKKRAKSTPASKTPARKTPALKTPASMTLANKTTASEKSSDKSLASGTSGEAGSIAPNIIKRGGAAPKWLQDEDDMVKQMIVDHPDWPMPKIYREYSTWVANTPYQSHGKVFHDYRADFVEFPKGVIVSDKERRKYDIAWRTYESVRQHCEKFKANVSNIHSFPPYTWDPCQTNMVAGQPKRAPPPRPAFFNNAARTPVPPVAGINAAAPAVASASRSSAAGTSTLPAASSTHTGNGRASGWMSVNKRPGPVGVDTAGQSDEDAAEQSGDEVDANAVNRLVSIVNDTPEDAEEQAAATAEESAEGDAGVESIEDFVAQQSASSSSVGEGEDDMEDRFE